VEIQQEACAISQSVEVRFVVRAELQVTLSLLLEHPVMVTDVGATLIDPHRAGTINRLARRNRYPYGIAARPSLADLVNSAAGLALRRKRGFAPPGSEYQTQFVVDGFLWTDNRSPSFGPEIEADDVQSMSIYTAGIPADMAASGRRGRSETPPGHETMVCTETWDFYCPGQRSTLRLVLGRLQHGWGKNTLSASAGGSRTDRYLNRLFLQNTAIAETTGEFAANYERDIPRADRLKSACGANFRASLFPNEQLQQAAGQRQDRHNFETMGVIGYQHVFSANVLADFRGMVRDDGEELSSNAFSTPIAAWQSNGFREAILRAPLSVHDGNQEWKAGFESDATFLRERFRYQITDPARLDPATPLASSSRDWAWIVPD